MNDETLCVKISPNYKKHPIVFWQIKDGKIAVHNVEGADTKEILEDVLNKFPNPESIDAEGFKVVLLCLLFFYVFTVIFFRKYVQV